MKALVFSGGGAKIHYHVGAARVLLEAESEYALFAGVSAGALVAAYLAQFPSGVEEEAIHCLEGLTKPLRESDLLSRWWPFGRTEGLWKSSFYDTSPLHRLVRRELSVDAIRTSGRKLRLGAVSLDGGDFLVLDEQSENLHDAVLASCAFPGVMTPVMIRGQPYVDGGVRVYTPIKAAIDAGATEIDIVLASPREPSPVRLRKTSAVHIAARAMELMIDEIIDKDLRQARLHNQLAMANPGYGKRLVTLRVIRPEHELPMGTWEFNSPKTAIVRAAGYRDAQLALAHASLVQ